MKLLLTLISVTVAVIAAYDTHKEATTTRKVTFTCAVCLHNIDTTGDKALRQWMDTPTRVKFKKWLILKKKK